MNSACVVQLLHY